jgi:hypothetical protein
MRPRPFLGRAEFVLAKFAPCAPLLRSAGLIWAKGSDFRPFWPLFCHFSLPHFAGGDSAVTMFPISNGVELTEQYKRCKSTPHR